jgi:hypothetical protein
MWIPLLFALLVFAAALTMPAWPYNRHWGYGPFGVAATFLTLLLVASWMGVIAIRAP